MNNVICPFNLCRTQKSHLNDIILCGWFPYKTYCLCPNMIAFRWHDLKRKFWFWYNATFLWHSCSTLKSHKYPNIFKYYTFTDTLHFLKAVSHWRRCVEFPASSRRGVRLDPITLQSWRASTRRGSASFDVGVTWRCVRIPDPIPLQFSIALSDAASEKPDGVKSSINWTFRQLDAWKSTVHGISLKNIFISDHQNQFVSHYIPIHSFFLCFTC